MLRILLAIIIMGAVGLGGCKKKEPTLGERVDEMKEEVEKTADDIADEAEDVADDAQDMAEEVQ
jgi:gas vesicle protein